MGNRNLLTKMLALIGTVLVWLPIVAPVFFSAVRLVQARRFLLDYLMPAELFLLVLVGGGLLIWAAIRARSQRALIGWGLGGAVLLLFGGQALAVATGLASGETEPTGWPWALVMGSISAYSLAVMVIGVGGARLVRDLFTSRSLPG